MQDAAWAIGLFGGFRPRSFFSSGGFVDGTDEAANFTAGPLDQERVTSLGSPPRQMPPTDGSNIKAPT